jgi:excinuclease ABC subunit B
MPLVAEQVIRFLTPDQKNDLLQELRKEMENAAKDLDFERAASLRDEIARLEGITLPAQKQRR